MAENPEGEAVSAGASVEALLTALVALALEERALRVAGLPTVKRADVLLVEAGLPIATVADLVGKKPDAVRMAFRRSRARAARQDTDE